MHFVIFFILFSSVYMALNAYAYSRFYMWLGGGKWQLFYFVFVLLMLCVWFIRQKYVVELWQKIILGVGYSWLGFIVLICCAFLAMDFIKVFCDLWSKLGFYGAIDLKKISTTIKSGRLVPFFTLIALICGLYSLYAAQNLRIYHQTLNTMKLPPEVSSIRLTVLSDLHLSALIGRRNLEEVVSIVNETEPDIFISLGDLVDTDMTGRDGDAQLLQKIKARYGKIGVLGNHEFLNGLENTLNFHKKAGIELLRGNSVEKGGILFAGVDDPMADYFDLDTALLDDNFKKAWQSNRFTIYLSHRPTVEESLLGFYDLQISGHTHGGQIWPGGPLFRMIEHKSKQHLSLAYEQIGFEKTKDALRNNLKLYVEDFGSIKNSAPAPDIGVDVDNGAYSSDLYLEKRLESIYLFITNGAGFWGPPMRFFAPPEILVLDIIAD